jgi:hypothetical protein
MVFVGRERETAHVTEALERGKNVLLTGIYGIGRTSLCKHVARISAERWKFVFIDFSSTPAAMCRCLIKELLPREHLKVGMKYKPTRFLIAHGELEEKRPCVIVVDNIAKLTMPKLALIRTLAWEKRFHFIAIVENFLPIKELNILRQELLPAKLMTLRYLTRSSSIRLLQHYSHKYHFYWEESELKHFASLIKGYPLGMEEFVTRKLQERERA